MRNRAKCKLCNSVLESFHEFDLVKCKCDEISISGGQVKFEASAKKWTNFLRVDDHDNDLPITVRSHGDEINIYKSIESECKPDLHKELDLMIESYLKLPQHVMLEPVSHADLVNFMMIVRELFKTV